MTPGFQSKLLFEDDGGFPYILRAPLVYQSAILPYLITVPVGFLTDLFSIPRFLWPFLPPSEAGDAAAVIHDYLYHTDLMNISRHTADRILLEAMTVLGVGEIRRDIIFAGVVAGGWHSWRQYRKAPVSTSILVQQ